MLHIASTFVVILIIAGLYNRRRNSPLHLKLMSTAFVIDVILVVYIEVTRQAIETVISEVHLFIWFHAAVSLSVLLCYVFMIYLGRGLYRGQFDNRLIHRNLGITFCVLRSVNYVTSFMM